MYYLIYVSYATAKMDVNDLRDLAKKCHQNNIEKDITGMLVYLDGKFLQVLEGNKGDVEKLFAHISTDPRHEKVRILIEGDIEKRNFEGWSMGFKMLDKQVFKDMSGLTDLDDFFKESSHGTGIDF